MPRYLVMKLFKCQGPKVECFNNREDMDKFLLFLRSIEQEYKVLVYTQEENYVVIQEWKSGSAGVECWE